MEIYLIRHTAPAIEAGICYGATDIAVADTFETEAADVKTRLPVITTDVYSSPLQRCQQLATALFGDGFTTDDRLQEMNFGSWEMLPWDDISRSALKRWADNVVFEHIPGGESYAELYTRSIQLLEEIIAKGKDATLVTHGGVIRCIMAYATDTPLADAFDFQIEYGRITHLQVLNDEIKVIFSNS
ncbi:alpha-ribazole phosphatase [Chitinophaga nivalis]|uniref:Alpha-ribazole phosphatase n=1 Tax=Chitinophaga nivalis TaxID=2991709 RepID=A0ABT3IWB9_9BACT|nr:alpha-ribazole phosphatase [Chitinophaga nivalis]MCW3462046.1 alpha-ribazole phosphatase [Chitinophaga nivalis]MCW3488262.1 alpha-ribazole phosphatase [Chitinophaga nivalis]